MQPIIRNALPEDAPTLKEIKPELTDDELQKKFSLMENGEEEFLVVEDNKELVCFVTLKWKGKPTHSEYPDLTDLYTKESARGKGYATFLVQECEQRAKKKGFSTIGLAASIDPECAARKLYAKLGYVHDGKNQYVDGVYNGVEDWVIDLEKTL